MRNKYVIVSGVIFGLMAAGQALRAFNQWPASIAGLEIPVWISWLAVAVAGSLCVWAFRSTQK
jgi:hypothetical protein